MQRATTFAVNVGLCTPAARAQAFWPSQRFMYPGSSMAEILLRLRDREVSRTPIATTRITLGRDPSCDVVIDNPAISRTHATLIYVDNQFRIRDNSANGLTVNGKGVKDSVLVYNDVIGIGKFELVLMKSAKEEPL